MHVHTLGYDCMLPFSMVKHQKSATTQTVLTHQRRVLLVGPDTHRGEIAGKPNQDTAPRARIEKKDFPKGTCDLKEPKLNFLIRDKIPFAGVDHLTRSGRSCSWALYRSPLCTIMGS